jgi:RNA recognition motif-containing protein
MATKLFVAGLDYGMTDNALRDLFADYGTVTSAQIITDRDTNRSKGFGFVEMSSEEECASAIENLNGKEVNGRSLAVNEARPREDRPQRSFSNSGNRDNRRGGNSGGNGGGNFRRPRY